MWLRESQQILDGCMKERPVTHAASTTAGTLMSSPTRQVLPTRLPQISQNSGPCLLFSPFPQVLGIISPRSQGQRSPLATLPQAKGLPAGSFPSFQVPVSSRHKGKEEQIPALLAATLPRAMLSSTNALLPARFPASRPPFDFSLGQLPRPFPRHSHSGLVAGGQ